VRNTARVPLKAIFGVPEQANQAEAWDSNRDLLAVYPRERLRLSASPVIMIMSRASPPSPGPSALTTLSARAGARARASDATPRAGPIMRVPARDGQAQGARASRRLLGWRGASAQPLPMQSLVGGVRSLIMKFGREPDLKLPVPVTPIQPGSIFNLSQKPFLRIS
jgi:hypothetical protein